MARIKRLPWAIISLGVSALLCVAFVVGCFKVADEFRSTNQAFARKEAAQTRRDDAARAATSARDTARSRVAGCEQYNGQQHDSILGTLDTVVSIIRVTNPVPSPVGVAREWATLRAVYDSQQKHHPDRDCTPDGIDRYLHQRVGTTRLSLAGRLPQPTEAAQ